MFISASTVCNMVDVLPATLKYWRFASLIPSPCAKGYSEAQVAQIRVIRALTSSGDTLSEIHTLLHDSWQYRPSGWEKRRQEFIFQLKFGTDQTRDGFIWKLYSTYSPEDIKAFILAPLATWLCEEGEGKQTLRPRFIACLLNHTHRLLRNEQSEKYAQPLLGIIKSLNLQPPSYCCQGSERVNPARKNTIGSLRDLAARPVRQ